MEIAWDIVNREFIKTPDNSQEVTELTWPARDVIPVTLYLVTPDDATGAYVQCEAPAGHTIMFGLKQSGHLDHVSFLASALSWTLNGSGAAAYYTAEVALNVAALNTLIDAETDSELDCEGEFMLYRTSDGAHTRSTKIDITIEQDVIRGNEAGPVALGYIVKYIVDAQYGNGVALVNTDGVTVATFFPTQ